MAKISKVGIANLKTIQADHVLNIIQALDGTDITDIVVSGSLGVANTITANFFSGNGSLLTNVTGSISGNVDGGSW